MRSKAPPQIRKKNRGSTNLSTVKQCYSKGKKNQDHGAISNQGTNPYFVEGTVLFYLELG